MSHAFCCNFAANSGSEILAFALNTLPHGTVAGRSTFRVISLLCQYCSDASGPCDHLKVVSCRTTRAKQAHLHCHAYVSICRSHHVHSHPQHQTGTDVPWHTRCNLYLSQLATWPGVSLMLQVYGHLYRCLCICRLAAGVKGFSRGQQCRKTGACKPCATSNKVTDAGWEGIAGSVGVGVLWAALACESSQINHSKSTAFIMHNWESSSV